MLVGTNFVAGSEGVKNKDYNPYTDKFAKDWSDPDAERKKRGETTALSYEAISMYLASAILGPLLDHQHSRFDVLHYEESGSGRVILNFPEVAAKALWGPDGVPPASVVEWFDRVHAVIPEGLDDVLSAAFVRETGVLETALWVPLLFGGAGVVIGVGHTLGDMFRLKTGAKEDRFIEGNTPLPRFLEECPGKPRLGWEPEWGVVYSASDCSRCSTQPREYWPPRSTRRSRICPLTPSMRYWRRGRSGSGRFLTTRSRVWPWRC